MINNRIGVQGITIKLVREAHSSYLLLTSDTPLRTLNTTIWGGGFGFNRHIVNRHVDKTYNCEDPVVEMNHFLQAQGLYPGDVAGMLTAAYVEDVGYRVMMLPPNSDFVGNNYPIDEALQVCAWVTMGLGNAARAGMERKPEELFPGTINIVLLIDGNLSDSAMANCLITATEAKTAALQDLGIYLNDQNGNERLATGTTTDAIVVASTGRGRIREYAGTATWLGHMIGRTVYEAAIESRHNYNKAIHR